MIWLFLGFSFDLDIHQLYTKLIIFNEYNILYAVDKKVNELQNLRILILEKSKKTEIMISKKIKINNEIIYFFIELTHVTYLLELVDYLQ